MYKIPPNPPSAKNPVDLMKTNELSKHTCVYCGCTGKPMPQFDRCTEEEFEEALFDLVEGGDLLILDNRAVVKLLKEEYTREIYEHWVQMNPEKAYGGSDEEG